MAQLSFARIRSPAPVDPVANRGTGSLMLAALVVALRSLALICRGHGAVALENLALRQQLAVFKRTVRRTRLRHRDRLFWMLVAPENSVLVAGIDVVAKCRYPLADDGRPRLFALDGFDRRSARARRCNSKYSPYANNSACLIGP